MQKWQQWEIASEADWGMAVQREAVIRLLAEQEQLSTSDVHEATMRLGIRRTLLYKLLRRYKQRPQTSSLLPWKRGRDNNITVLDKERELLLTGCIKDFYLRPERPSLAVLIQEVNRQSTEQGLPAPPRVCILPLVHRGTGDHPRSMGMVLCLHHSMQLSRHTTTTWLR
jgi:putative transposase